jgi:probable rRNA maturation factor
VTAEAGPLLVSVVADEDAAVEPALAQTIEAAALAALRHEGVAAGELTVALVGGAEIARLNRAYRGVDAVTDVLSFGMEGSPAVAGPPGAPPYLGDIAICAERAAAQARDYGHSAAREFAFLTVHGVLHLLGHDHHEPAEERRMREREEAVLAEMGLGREATGR